MDFGRIANQIRNDRNDSPRTNGLKGDISKFQFWPTAVAMGSLIGRQFIQVSYPLEIRTC